MIKHLIASFFFCLVTFSGVAQDNVVPSHYFEELDVSLDLLYCRFQQIIPVGSFRKVAHAKIGAGVEIGQHVTLSNKKMGTLNWGFEYIVGLSTNQVDLKDFKKDENITVQNEGYYVNYETGIGPSAILKKNDDLRYQFSVLVGPSILSSPRSISYTTTIGEIEYNVSDSPSTWGNSANNWFRPRYAFGGTLIYKNVMLGLKHTRSKFKMLRQISVYPSVDGEKEYSIVSRSSSWRILVGVAF